MAKHLSAKAVHRKDKDYYKEPCFIEDLNDVIMLHVPG